MPINTIEDAKKLRDKLRKNTAWHERLDVWRRVRDRDMEDDLQSFKAMLPLDMQEHWVPYQTPIIEDEITSITAILASNTPELSLVSLSNKGKNADLTQKAEPCLEALYAALNPSPVRMERYDAILGDGLAFEFIDLLPPTPHLAKYADRESLKDGDDEDYNAAYEKTGDHDEAYTAVTDEAERRGGIRWRKRVADARDVHWFENKDGIAETCEAYSASVSSLLTELEGYGLTKTSRGLTIEGAEDPVGSDTEEYQKLGSISTTGDTVQVTHLRTYWETVTLIEGISSDKAKNVGKDGIMIRMKSPFPLDRKTCGAYLTAGKRKKRGSASARYEPVVLPLIVEAQQYNAQRSVRQAMIYAEAARDLVQEDAPQPIAPVEGSMAAKSLPSTDGRTPTPVRGKVSRIPSTDVELTQSIAETAAAMEQYRSREFFSGAGSAGEPALHLARLQTAQLTKLVPIQTNCAETDKRQIEDIIAAQAEMGDSMYLFASSPENQASLELTPEMLGSSFDIRIVIGADTPESVYAYQQVSRQEVAAGTYGMTKHRENIGDKNPRETVRQMAVDSIVYAVLGTDQKPGAALTNIIKMIEDRSRELVDSLLPIEAPPEQPSQVDPTMTAGNMPQMDANIPGAIPGMVAPAVQTGQMDGQMVPVAPGA